MVHLDIWTHSDKLAKHLFIKLFGQDQEQKHRGVWGVKPPADKKAQFAGQLNLFARQI